jgi:hypothetical protein
MKLVVFDEAAEPGGLAGSGRVTATNMTEMYNVTQDVAEMINVAVTDPSGSSAARLVLQKRLDHLRACKEDSCRN